MYFGLVGRIATVFFVLTFAVASFSQTSDPSPPQIAPSAQQDHDRAEPASAAPTPALSTPPSQSQTVPNAPQPQSGNIIGTVTALNDDIVPGATVVLEGPAPADHRTTVTNDKGFFQFQVLQPGTYHVAVSAKGFAKWTSPAVILSPGQAFILTGCKLKIETARTTIYVGYTAEQIAAAQVKIEEKQRVFGFIPNFYVVYDPDPEPLTTKLKFDLALKTSIDPVTIIGVGIFAGIEQAGDTPNYVQGMRGYAERYGAIYADGFTDIMVGGAILPSLLHQDPRYFYQGTGTKKSRALHAISGPFVCHGDNGDLQANYSSLGGDLAAASISNAYYPPSNRGAGLMFENFLIDTGERVAADLMQEFVLRKLTPKAKKQN